MKGVGEINEIKPWLSKGAALLSALPHERVLTAWCSPGVVHGTASILHHLYLRSSTGTTHIWLLFFIALKER